MIQKLLKITEIATMQKSAQFSNYRRYRLQIFIVQVENLNQDCVKLFTSLSLILSDKAAVKERHGRAGSVHCFK